VSLLPAVGAAPEAALARALELGCVAVAAVGGAVTLLAGAFGGSAVAGGVAAGGVLALALMWVSRVAVLRAQAAPPTQIAVYVLLSYAVKAVLVLVTTVLVARADAFDRAGFGVTLLAGVVASIALEIALTRPTRTATLAGAPSPADRLAGDDDTAVSAARAAHARSVSVIRPADSVPPR